MQAIINNFKKNWVIIAFLFIIVGAIFVRTYNFQDWLYFKMDQSRDAILLSKAVEQGPGYLPLLGARVGAVELQHGFLRLGPISYYFQYLAGVIFHSTQPYVFAYPDLFFTTLAIPLLYLLARLYFSRKNSLLIMAMYAFSFIIIQYSRFAWNPNSLQFFLLLSFYGLLRFLNEANSRRKKWWLVIWAVAITIGSQLHFFGFFSLLGISGLLIIFHLQLWKKAGILVCLRRDALQSFAVYAGIVLLVVGFFYTPVIISDIREKGQNTHNFFEALGSKAEKKPLQEKVVASVTGNLQYYCLITTSQCYKSDLKKEYPAVIVTILILLSGLILAIRGLRKKKLTTMQRDFLALLIVWVGVFTILTLPVAFQLRPRFFIVVFAIPFIFLGLLFEYLEERIKHKCGVILPILIAVGIIVWNSHGTYEWFEEQAASQNKSVAVKRTLILKTKDGVTLGELQRAADFIYARHQVGKNVYYYVKPEHVRPIEYLLMEKHDAQLNFTSLKINQDASAQFFIIVPNKKGGLDKVTKKYGLEMQVISSEKIGQLLVAEIDFPTRTVSSDIKIKKDSSSEDRLFWKDVFGTKEDVK